MSIIDALSMTVRSAGKQFSTIMLAYGVIAILLLTTYGALVFAIAAALSDVYGPVAAAVMVGLGSLVLAGVVYIWARSRVRRFRKRRHLRTAMSTVQRSMIGAAVPAIARASPVVSLIVVAAGAAFLTRRSRNRS